MDDYKNRVMSMTKLQNTALENICQTQHKKEVMNDKKKNPHLVTVSGLVDNRSVLETDQGEPVNV